MASLANLPPEMVRHILSYITSQKDLASISHTCRCLYSVAHHQLYGGLSQLSLRCLLHWASFTGRIETVQTVLEYGADPNWYWVTLAALPWVTEFLLAMPDRTIEASQRRRRHCGKIGDQDRYGRRFGANYGTSSRLGAVVPMTHLTPTSPFYTELTSLQVDRMTRTPDWNNRSSRSHAYVNSAWTPLHLAAREGTTDIVKLLLENGANPSLCSLRACDCEAPCYLVGHDARQHRYHPQSALHLALCSGGDRDKDDSTAKLLISAGAPVHLDRSAEPCIAPFHGRDVTALHTACQFGRIEAVRFLIESGHQKNIEEQDKFSETPLDYAYLYGKKQCFEYLLEKGAEIEPTKGRQSLLSDAFRHGLLADALLLMEHGIKCTSVPNTTKECNRTEQTVGEPPIHACLQLPWSDGPDKFRGKKYTRRDRYTNYSMMPRLSRVEYHRKGIECLKFMIESGESIEVKNPARNNETPLIAASRNGILPAVSFLLQSGASVHAMDDEGVTALLAACYEGCDVEILRILLEYGASADVKDHFLKTPLSKACGNLNRGSAAAASGQIEAIRLLLDYGAQPSVPIMYTVVQSGDAEVADLLFSRLGTTSLGHDDIKQLFRAAWKSPVPILNLVLGIDKDQCIIKDAESVLRLTMYAESNDDAIHWLLDKGASSAYATPDKGNALYWAVSQKRDHKLVERLLHAGCDPNVVRVTPKSRSCTLTQALKVHDKSMRQSLLEILLTNGANVHLVIEEIEASRFDRIFGNTLSTPLYQALTKEDPDMDAIKMMLQSPSFEHWTEDLQESYLASACRNQLLDFELLWKLIDAGAGNTFRTRTVHKMLHHVLRRVMESAKDKMGHHVSENAVDVITHLHELGADWEYTYDGASNADLLRGLGVMVAKFPELSQILPS
ncbi:ankyrin repeat-containing domain protein [Xylariales sp. PMI_506]|nr:ankyrin repeat-containing domain protein [Xylariales sp. PMI_506]